ncbi:hypothetical protein LS73_000540 [Helicobacter muridarum]|uniref:4-diphosphocytidyl-2-C-methyl-D-erythritol kinase n=1 Tax=Helicobacter muridarum TaxID=216 RepID=A0A099TVQ3_9HELI|nr:hypothetical protein [Helicobacter muridarum]TLE01660.1 hypothetical protein LS73_000540 [Helicobacter muridarum]STQ86284.1 4-diphosphocytidyl-2-C-methyl-D-erythritol kinase [Helicobacter muridarum]
MQNHKKNSLENHNLLSTSPNTSSLINKTKNYITKSTKIPQTSKQWIIKAYPKINIALKVFYKNQNTNSNSILHEIASRFHLVLGELYDIMSFSLHTADSLCFSLDSNLAIFRKIEPIDLGIEFILQGDFDCDIESNLIYKSYKILLEFYNLKRTQNLLSSQTNLDNTMNLSTKQRSILIKVNKKIPTGSGLGGGSVNAAISLIMLNDMLDCRLSVDELLACAKTLGSDVSFFVMVYLQGGDRLHSFFLYDFAESSDNHLPFCSANVFGTGEIVEPFFEEALSIKLHCNNISCHTGKVYDMFDTLCSTSIEYIHACDFKLCRLDSVNANTQFSNLNNIEVDFSLDSKTLLSIHSIFELNDLYLPASSLYPLESIRAALDKEYHKVFFSGSGSTFFSLDM